jgi:hypothetical protein
VLIPAVDSVETARAARSFFEEWSLDFFWALIACELAEFIFHDSGRWTWRRITGWSIQGPEYQTIFSLHSFLTIAAIATFGIAVAGEVAASGMSDLLDKFTDSERSAAAKQIGASLIAAGTANKQSVALRLDLEQEKQKTAKSEKESGDAQRALVADLAAEKSASAKTMFSLEEEKGKRLRLAQSFLPREFFKRTEASVILSALTPMSLVFEFIDDPEARSIGEQIYGVFPSGWKAVRQKAAESTIPDGITFSQGAKGTSSGVSIHPDKSRGWVISTLPLTAQSSRDFDEAITMDLAVENLLSALWQSGMEADKGFAANELPTSVLLIQIGRKKNLALLATTIAELGQPDPGYIRFSTGVKRRAIPDSK